MKPLLDIFSKKKQKPKAPAKITIDYREKNSLVYSELVHLGFDIDMRELKVADYLVNDVAIERKTVSDFITSMINKRLSKQLYELQQYKNRLLIVEGIDEQELYSDSHYTEKSGMHPNSIRGFLLSIILSHKTPIIFTKNYEDTAKFIEILSKRKPRELSLNVSKKSLDKKERMQFILEGFPGIGPKTARKLLEKFGTIKAVINASEEELRETLGKKAEVFSVVKEQYK
jgi:ERCC4-type nuclease